MSRVQLSTNPVVYGALRRPVAMLMILVSMLVLGAVSLSRIPVELVPAGLAPPVMRVSVAYPNATATDVEEQITLHLERALASTPGIDRIDSTSRAGSAGVLLVFDESADMDVAYRQVRDRVARARAELPDEVTDVNIRKASVDDLPVAYYGVTWDPELADPLGVIDRRLVTSLERLDGIAQVVQRGRADPEVLIDVDRGLSAAANLEITELVEALASSNFTLASGELEESDGRYLLRSVASWQSVAEIEEIIVNERGLRLKDVATVVLGLPPKEHYDRYNGRPSLVLVVQKESQANTVATSDRVVAAVAHARTHPDMRGIFVEPFFVQGNTIRESLDQVVNAGVQGGAIALLVLLFFLRRFRLTFLIALSIPLSLFLAMPVMHFTNQSINLISLVGMMICVGLVVDNSVVVAENIGRYRRRGLASHVAALQGAGEVGLAITLATLTTIVVFLPAALLSKGPTQFMMVRLVTPVCVSLVASLFVGLVLIPLASALLLNEDPEAERSDRWWWRLDKYVKGVLGRVYVATMGRVARVYDRVLARSLRRRFDVVMISILVLVSAVVPATRVSCEVGENLGGGWANVDYTMPPNTQLEDAYAFFTGLEALLEAKKKEHDVQGYYVGFDDDGGEIEIFFKPTAARDRPFKEVAKELTDQLPTPAGWRKRSQLGNSDGAADDAFHVEIFGEQHDVVQETREELEKRLETIEGVTGIRGQLQDNQRREELVLSIERGLSERYGIASDVVATTVAQSIRGARLARYHTERRDIDVWVRYREEDRKDVSQLLDYRVSSAMGTKIPISVVTQKRIEMGDARLTRTNKRAGAVIRLEIDDDTRLETIARIGDVLATYRLPEGVSFKADHDDERVREVQRDLALAMALGIIFIFLLMGFLFESFVLPLSVLPSIPLSFVGVWWFLYAAGESIDPLAGIGIVLLLGVVVNNAIVLIDFINRARELGLDREAAIMSAGRLRLRPILMTALTTIGGMFPLAFSESTGEGIPYGAFGKALVGGMTAATVLTLIVIPVTYTYFDDLRRWMAEAWSQWLVRPRRRG